jgi:hypothetical protein
MPSTMGKSISFKPMNNLLPLIGVYLDAVTSPTTAKLVGRTHSMRVKGQDIAIAITPTLLEADVLLIDECENIFKARADYAAMVMTTLRKNMDTIFSGKGEMIQNDSSSNTLIRPFYGRSTLIAGSFPSKPILQEVRTGTLQRAIILTAKNDLSYGLKILESKIRRGNESGEHIEAAKQRCLRELANIINTRVKQVRDSAMQSKKEGHYYLSYRVDDQTYNEFIERVKKRIALLDDDEDYQQLSSYYIRGLSHITKIAAIISIMNGRVKYVGVEELEYAEKLYFDTLQKMVNTLEFVTPKEDTLSSDFADYTVVMKRLIQDTPKERAISKEIIITALRKYWKTSKATARKRFMKIVDFRGLRFVKTGRGRETELVFEKEREEDESNGTSI